MFGDTCFRVVEKRKSFPLSEGCCSRTGYDSEIGSVGVFSHAGKLYSKKRANLGIRIIAIYMFMSRAIFYDLKNLII